MATHDYVLANASGAAFRADLNNALAAIVSNNSNATEPATTYAYMWWMDTTSGQLKQRNAANDGWITIREIDGTMLMEDGTVDAPGLAFASDLDTGFFRTDANQIAVATNGIERVEFGTSEVVFNDGGEDVDFRVEGDTEASLFVVDAGNNRIGIAEPSPGTLVEIGSEAPYVTLKNSTEEDIDGGRESRLIFEGEQSGGEISTLARIEASHDGTADDEAGQLIFSTNDGSDGAAPTEALTIDSNQNATFAGDVTASSFNGGPLAGMRNLLINGNPIINQRGYVSGTTTSGANEYTLDRWRVVTSGQSITYTDSNNIRTVTAPAGGVEQVIEGVNILSGTYTLSWTGTATATVDGSSVANGGQVTLTGGSNATVRFSGGTFSLAQLETGTVATPFERRSHGQELALCQRYYYNFNVAYKHDQLNYAAGYRINHLVPMRTTPTLTVGGSQRWSDPVNGVATGSPVTTNFDAPSKTFTPADPFGFFLSFAKTSTGTPALVEYQENYRASAEL
jgi:hypothetical protein